MGPGFSWTTVKEKRQKNIQILLITGSAYKPQHRTQFKDNTLQKLSAFTHLSEITKKITLISDQATQERALTM